MPLTLDPAWRMRRERGYILLYKLSEAGFLVDYKLITPQAAVLFSLFDGVRAVREVVEALSYVTGLPLEASRLTVDRFLQEYRGLLIDSSLVRGKMRTYDPLKFVMNPNDVDLTPKRLVAPLTLVYMVTNRCYADCIYCYANKEPTDLLPLPPLKVIGPSEPVLRFTGDLLREGIIHLKIPERR